MEALVRIEGDGAYANLLLPSLLDRGDLDERDRRFVTELVYGTTRMRRACDHLYSRFLHRDDLDRQVRSALRLGTYQLAFTNIPDHAAVSETLNAVHGGGRGLVNAVLRKVASADPWYPDLATELSYPDWIVDLLTEELGEESARSILAAMNERAEATPRADGYVQDLGSQWVAAVAGDVSQGAGSASDVTLLNALDVCAAPGGKATALASQGFGVVAADRRKERLSLVMSNVGRLELGDRVSTIAMDGTAPSVTPASFDLVLVDAPCSGLGTLRRRADARWQAEPESVPRLAKLQSSLLRSAAPLVKPGGHLVYSVCTLSRAETLGIDEWSKTELSEWKAVDIAPPAGASDALLTVAAATEPLGRGRLLLPHSAGTDGMYALVLTR